MALNGVWAVLDLAPTNDEREIRRAYARRLKEVHPEDDPEGFQRLREAHDSAMNMARRGWAVPTPRGSGRKRKTDAVTPETPASPPIESRSGWSDDDGSNWTERPTDGDGGGWSDPETPNWRDMPFSGDAGPGWNAEDGDRWEKPTPRPEPEIAPEVRAELAAEQARQDAHTALCEELDALIYRQDARENDGLDLLMRILRSPAMDSLKTHSNTEFWLAHALTHGGPAADGLINPAIQFFGWSNARIGVDLTHAAPVLRRREALLAIQQLARPMTVGHDAWKALRAKPTLFRRISERLDPFLAKQVAALLARADYDLPDLHKHLDPDAVRSWQARLDRPRFSAMSLLFLLIAPPLLSLLLVGLGLFGPWNAVNLIACWIVVFAVLLGIGSAWIRGVLTPAQKWRDRYPWDEPLWKRLGWAPAVVAVLALSPVLTIVDWLWPLVLLAGLACVAWARIVTSHIERPTPSRYRLNEFIGVAPILFYVVFMPGSASQPSLAVALLTATLAFRTGGHAITQEWISLDRRLMRRVSLILIGATLAVSALAVLTGLGGVPGIGIGAVCGLAFMDRALATNRFGVLFNIRRGWLTVGWIPVVLIAASPALEPMTRSAPIVFGLWLTSAALLTGISALLPEPKPKSKPRPKGRRPGQLA